MSRASSRTKLNSRQQKNRGEKKQGSTIDLEAVKKVEIPQLAWKIIPQSATKSLKETSDIDEMAVKLADILGLTKSKECLREAAELDYFVAGFWCASNEWQLTNEQLSAFITLLHTVLYNLKERSVSLSENIKELQTAMANVGIPGAPTALECFTSELATATVQYIQTTLFQHYTLFQYLFTEEQETETVTTQVEIEVPNIKYAVFPSPLEESLPLEVLTRCKDSDPKPDELFDGVQEEVAHEESEEAVHTSDVVTVSSLDEDELRISSKDMKTLMEDLAKTTLQPFQTLMLEKITEKEDAMASRLSKLEKTLNI